MSLIGTFEHWRKKEMQHFHWRKRKLKLEEDAEVKEKKALEAAIKSPETDIEEYNIAAEKEDNLALWTKANSFRGTVCHLQKTL